MQFYNELIVGIPTRNDFATDGAEIKGKLIRQLGLFRKMYLMPEVGDNLPKEILSGKVDPEGKMYGSVTSQDIVQLFEKHNIKLSKKNIAIKKIKNIEHTIVINNNL